MKEASGPKQTSNKDGKTALILGATGLVGSYCLNQLLAHPNYEKVIVLVRRPLLTSSYGYRHAETVKNSEKIVQMVTDLNDFSDVVSNLPIDDVFCCLGTTIKKAGSKSAFRHVDFQIPLNFAAYCYNYQTTHNKMFGNYNISEKQDAAIEPVNTEATNSEPANNEPRKKTFKFFGLVSSVGANSSSKVFYSKTKGEIEQALNEFPHSVSQSNETQESVHELKQKLAHNLTIVRPSIILGPRAEKRFGEDLGKLIMRIFSFAFIGNLRRYKPVHAADIAAALITSANTDNHQSSSAVADITAKVGANANASANLSNKLDANIDTNIGISNENKQALVIESEAIERNAARY